VDCGDLITMRGFSATDVEPGRTRAGGIAGAKAAVNSPKIFLPVALHQTHPLGQKVVVGLGKSTADNMRGNWVASWRVVLARRIPLLRRNYEARPQETRYESGRCTPIG